MHACIALALALEHMHACMHACMHRSLAYRRGAAAHPPHPPHPRLRRLCRLSCRRAASWRSTERYYWATALAAAAHCTTPPPTFPVPPTRAKVRGVPSYWRCPGALLLQDSMPVGAAAGCNLPFSAGTAAAPRGAPRGCGLVPLMASTSPSPGTGARMRVALPAIGTAMPLYPPPPLHALSCRPVGADCTRQRCQRASPPLPPPPCGLVR